MYGVDNPAGFWVRVGATILDMIFLGVVGLFISMSFYDFFFGNVNVNIDLLEVLYHLLLPVIWYGYTVGKRILEIRIARVDGEKVGIGTMLLRNVVGGIVYALTLGFGLIVSAFMVAIREDKRSIHDLIAGTYVTHDPPDEYIR
ncbi:RDD family protein [Evansella sp. AB-rgal1]|uniref:RDD family protein n=1 Tax=Evansella sp. AB-rgal1 TaxID=3242696 RepID=UPI00359CFDF2